MLCFGLGPGVDKQGGPHHLLSGKINKYIDIIGFAGLVPDSLTDLFADAARTNEDFF